MATGWGVKVFAVTEYILGGDRGPQSRLVRTAVRSLPITSCHLCARRGCGTFGLRSLGLGSRVAGLPPLYTVQSLHPPNTERAFLIHRAPCRHVDGAVCHTAAAARKVAACRYPYR